MKRLITITLALAGVLLLSACAASRQAYYDANTKAAEANALAVKAKFDALAAASANCQTEGCTGMALMGIAMTETPQAQAIRQYRSEGWQLVGLGERALALGFQAWSEDSRNDLFGGLFEAFSNNAGDRSIRIDQSDHSNNSTNIADSFNSEAGDTFTDSGNTTTRDSNNGNAGRDRIGRDRIDNAGNFGADNRQGSDGPIDNSDPGDDCTGESCNPVEPTPATEG